MPSKTHQVAGFTLRSQASQVIDVKLEGVINLGGFDFYAACHVVLREYVKKIIFNYSEILIFINIKMM